MVNKVILVGRLTSDPEVKALPTGGHVATLRVATNTYGGRDEEGGRKEYTEYHQLVLFGRLAEVAGTYLRKGRLVYADGRLRHRSWDGEDGRKRYVSDVVVDVLQMLGPRSDDAAAAGHEDEEDVGSHA